MSKGRLCCVWFEMGLGSISAWPKATLIMWSMFLLSGPFHKKLDLLTVKLIWCKPECNQSQRSRDERCMIRMRGGTVKVYCCIPECNQSQSLMWKWGQTQLTTFEPSLSPICSGKRAHAKQGTVFMQKLISLINTIQWIKCSCLSGVDTFVSHGCPRIVPRFWKFKISLVTNSAT